MCNISVSCLVYMVSSGTEDPGMNTLKSVIKRSFALILAAVCITSLCACSRSRNGGSQGDINEPDACCVYIRDTFGLDLFDYCEYAEMDLDVSDPDEFAYIKFEVKSSKEDEFKNYLEEKLGQGTEYENDQLPGLNDHEFAHELKKMEPIRYYVMFKSGVKIKTRDTNFYLATDGDNTYLYIFG